MFKKLLFLIFILSFYTNFLYSQSLCTTAKISDIAGNENPAINCAYPFSGNCLQLKVAVPEIRQTTSYAVSSASFTPYGAFNEGNPLYINEEQDDLFISKIPISFNFCFFGKNYNEVIIGSNGVVTFDLMQLGNVNIPNVTNSNPDPTLQKNSIFGPLSDLIFSATSESEIYYHIIGTAPCRKLIINYYKGRLVGCDQTVTSQIVLSEGSNEIEVFIQNKPIPCNAAQFKNSLVGIINDTGTVGYSPVSRNTGVWGTANEAWKFTPNGAPIPPQIEWFNAANQRVGTGVTVYVCPKKDEAFTAKLTYPTCSGSSYVLQNASTVTFVPDYPLANDFIKILCGSSISNLNLDDFKGNLTTQNVANFNFKFYNSLSEAQAGGVGEPTLFDLRSNRTFYVRVENSTNPACFRTSVLTLKLIGASLLKSTVDICDSNNDGIEENYQLSKLNSQFFTSPIDGVIRYFSSLQDANNNVNAITTLNINDATKIYLSYSNATCTQVFGPVDINFLSAPVVTSPVLLAFTTCDLRGDLTEPFEFKEILGPLVSSDPDSFTLKFYTTYAQAYSGTGGSITTIKDGQYDVFVRIEDAGGCFSIATVKMDIKLTTVKAKGKQVYVCFNGTEDVQVNLADHAPEMLTDISPGITTAYYSSLADAEDDTLPSPTISNFQTITDDGNLVTKTFYVKFTDAANCYSVKELKISLVNVVIAQPLLEVCDFKNDNEEDISLPTLSAKIIGNQTATVKYFTTQAEANAYVVGATTLSTLNVRGASTLWVRIESFGCSRIFEINVNLVPTPIVTATIPVIREEVCDNNNDGQEPFDLTQFTAAIYGGSDVTFQYYRNYDPATNALTGIITTPTAFVIGATSQAFVKVSFIDINRCWSVSTLDIQLNFLPAIVLKSATLKQCSFESTLNETYDLTEAATQIFNQAENQNDLSTLAITYYLTEADANSGNVLKQIPSAYISGYSDVVVWVRYTSTLNNCYSVAPIELKTYLPPKVKVNIVIPNLCDTNLDGLYEVNLNDYTSLILDIPNPENSFKFFETQLAAEDPAGIPIANPGSYIIDPARPQVWVRVQNIPGCYATAPIDFSYGQKITLLDYGPFQHDDTCDVGNDGIETLDLTKFENAIFLGATFEYYPSLKDLHKDENKIATPSSYIFNRNLGPDKIFVKVNKAGFCPDLVEINLSLKNTPMFSLPEDGYFFCPESFVDIQPDFTGLNIVSYEWKNPAGEIVSTTNELPGAGEEGTYNIKVMASNNCTFSTDFKVSKFEVPIITDLIASGNSITVIATGSKKILYAKNLPNSTDPGVFTESNVFHNLPAGVTIFFVKFEGSDCSGLLKKGLILDVKNVITPNGDGKNDTWSVDDLSVFEGKKASLKIFNRTGQIIFEQESATQLEWNGKSDSRTVATDSYWYILTLADGRVFTGWILVKNKN